MKTFASKEKQTASAGRKTGPYVHHPMGPAQQAQQAKVRHILRATGAQARLSIGQSNDKYEQEADRIADQVMRMPDPKLQRQPENEEEEEMLQAKPLADQITPLVQRQEEPEEEEEAEPGKEEEQEESPPILESVPTQDADELGEEEEPIQAKLIQRQPVNEEEEEPVQAMRIQRQMADMHGTQTSRFGYVGPKAKSQQADRVADHVMAMPDPKLQCQPENEEEEETLQAKEISGHTPDVSSGLESSINSLKGGGQPLDPASRSFFEPRFGHNFSAVRLHTGSAAADVASRVGARAFARGRDIVFGSQVADPEDSVHRRLLAHELTHIVQQGMGAGMPASSKLSSLSPALPSRVQAAPLVTNVVTSAVELGVGGRDITARATVAGARPRLTWTINPGGAAPAGVRVIGRGRRVRIHAGNPVGGAIIGGTPIVVRAEVTGTAGDFFNAPPVMLVQVVSATYTAAPPLAPVPSLTPGVPPANSAEPNRDGIAGNTAVVNAITAPAGGRAITTRFRRSLGARIAGATITPGRRTGDIRLRITDTATRARLDETQPAVAGPATHMAELTVNAVPTRVSALAGAGALGPYGVLNAITFASSDNRHPPLTRIVGELITHRRDDFNIAPPNGAFNPAFLLALAVPANAWNDQLITPSGILSTIDALPAIDVNRFVGPGVPHLPRRLIYRQRFQYSFWQGAGTVVSRTFADGQHIRSLIGRPGAFQFRTEHRFGRVRAPRHPEPYVGNPLIILSGITAAPTAAGATDLAADGVATANLAVVSSVAGRTVNWVILSGDMTVIAGNPAALPATATLQAGARSGNFRVRAADSVFPNRRATGRIRVARVRLRRMRAAPRNIPAGVFTTNVSLNAEPGGRTVNWAVDAAASAAGVTVAPAVTGPGAPAMVVTVNRPPGFSGRVIVTATDSVLVARTNRVRIRFL